VRRDLRRERAHGVERDQQAQVTRRARVVFPWPRRLDQRGALGHRNDGAMGGRVLLAVGDRTQARPYLLLERIDRVAERARRVERLR
jgi:hypothetical protein